MHRTNTLDLLERYNPTEFDEIRFKEDIVAFIIKNSDCFERINGYGHVTSSAWLLSKCENNALLTHHAKLDDWFQLGGHCDGDSDILKVALKEAREESGIEDIEPVRIEIFDIDIHLIPENAKEAAHYHYDIRFLLQVKSDENFKINRESKQLSWISKDSKELPTNKKSVIRMFNKWRSL